MQVGGDLYRIEEDICSFMIADIEEELELMPHFRDIIRVSLVEERTVQFITVHERACMKRYEFILGEELFELSTYHSLLQETIGQGDPYKRTGQLTLFFEGIWFRRDRVSQGIVTATVADLRSCVPVA